MMRCDIWRLEMQADDRDCLAIELDCYTLAVPAFVAAFAEKRVAADQPKAILVARRQKLIRIFAAQLGFDRRGGLLGEFLKPDHIGLLGADLANDIGGS